MISHLIKIYPTRDENVVAKFPPEADRMILCKKSRASSTTTVVWSLGQSSKLDHYSGDRIIVVAEFTLQTIINYE